MKAGAAAHLTMRADIASNVELIARADLGRHFLAELLVSCQASPRRRARRYALANYPLTFSTILPRAWPDWLSSCARPASASGKTSVTIGLTIPWSMSSARRGSCGMALSPIDGDAARTFRSPRIRRRADGRCEHAARLDRGPEARLPLAADRVEDGIDLAGAVERFLGVIDETVDPEIAEELRVPGRAGADHGGASPFGELNGEGADPTGGAVDQDRHTRLRIDAVRREEGLPGGRADDRDGRGMDVIDRARLACDPARLDREVLGMAPVRLGPVLLAIDLIADREAADTGADRGDNAGEIDAGRDRQDMLDVVLEVARAQLPVDGIDAGRMHRDEHLARSRFGSRGILVG